MELSKLSSSPSLQGLPQTKRVSYLWINAAKAAPQQTSELRSCKSKISPREVRNLTYTAGTRERKPRSLKHGPMLLSWALHCGSTDLSHFSVLIQELRDLLRSNHHDTNLGMTLEIIIPQESLPFQTAIHTRNFTSCLLVVFFRVNISFHCLCFMILHF